jgi:hypothetical protein
MKQLLFGFLVIVALGACGGKKGATTPEPEGETTDESTEPSNDGVVVTPETMDQIQRMFERKGTAVSRCLAVAVDNKELPKNSRGKVTLGVTIATSGQVDEVKVIKATLESDSLTKCILDKVREIQFPAVPKLYPTTYTYAFEAV